MRIMIPEYVENVVLSRANRGNFIYEVLASLIKHTPFRTYNNTTRPDATQFTAGSMIFNTDDSAPNFSTGTKWVDAMGNDT
jgi:hypothetical protein